MIQTGMLSDDQKIIVAKERSDLHITCETSANGVGVEWTANGAPITPLANGDERIEMTDRNATVNGQLKTLHTLIIRNTSTMDRAEYRCQSGLASDEVVVHIPILASK